MFQEKKVGHLIHDMGNIVAKARKKMNRSVTVADFGT
jgi:hypothetical protein